MLVCGSDRVRQPDRHLAVTNRLRSGRCRRLQRCSVLYIEIAEHVQESLGEPALDPEGGVSWGTDDESGRDRQARSSQLSEIRALATSKWHVGSRKVRKRPDRDEFRWSNGGIVRDRGHRPKLRRTDSAGIRASRPSRSVETCGPSARAPPASLAAYSGQATSISPGFRLPILFAVVRRGSGAAEDLDDMASRRRWRRRRPRRGTGVTSTRWATRSLPALWTWKRMRAARRWSRGA